MDSIQDITLPSSVKPPPPDAIPVHFSKAAAEPLGDKPVKTTTVGDMLSFANAEYGVSYFIFVPKFRMIDLNYSVLQQ